MLTLSKNYSIIINIKQNIGGIKMSKVFELKKMELADGKNLCVELVVLNENLLESIIEENGIREFRVTNCGIGINLVDILNGKDLTKIIPKDKVHLLEIVLNTFEEQFLGDGEEDEFYTLSIDEKLNAIYELLKGE